MSRPASPYDNATCQSFLKTLKREEIRASAYRDFEDLQIRVEEFIDRYYNRCQLHSALRYSSPEERRNNEEDEQLFQDEAGS
jgi:transposase InsO family protein